MHMDAQIIDAVDKMIREICTQAVGRTGASSRALRALFSRVAGSWDSLRVLVMDARTQVQLNSRVNDCAAILRCMYDAYLQAAYIATDPQVLGKLYLDYVHVETQIINEILEQDNKMSRIFAASPMRPEGEKMRRKRYAQVKDAYKTPKGKDRIHWYVGSLRDLARKVGKGDEYVWFVKRSNSSVHSGAFATMHGPPIQTAQTIEQIALLIVSRTGNLVVKNDGLRVSKRTNAIIEAGEADILNLT